MAGRQIGSRQRAFIRAISGPSSAVNLRLVRDAGPRVAHVRGKLGGAFDDALRPPPKTGLAEQPAEERVGLGVLRMRLDDGARRGESLVNAPEASRARASAIRAVTVPAAAAAAARKAAAASTRRPRAR